MVRIRDNGSVVLDRSNHSVNSVRSLGSFNSYGSHGSAGTSISVRSEGRVRDGGQRNNTAFKRSQSQINRRQLPPSQDVSVNRNLPRKLNSRGKGVAFGMIEIREHAITIGDNPGSLGGAPITISWQAQHSANISVDEYERMRPNRRTGAEMNIPETIRADMLRKAGHTRAEIQQATKAANIARRQRKQSVAAMELGPIGELGGNLLRGGKKIMTRGKRKQERESLQQAMEQAKVQPPQQHAQRVVRKGVNHRPAPAKPPPPMQQISKYPNTSSTIAKPVTRGQHAARRPGAQSSAPIVKSMNSITISNSQDEQEC